MLSSVFGYSMFLNCLGWHLIGPIASGCVKSFSSEVKVNKSKQIGYANIIQDDCKYRKTTWIWAYHVKKVGFGRNR